MNTTNKPTPKEIAVGLRTIAKDRAFKDWPEAREELCNAADLIDSNFPKVPYA